MRSSELVSHSAAWPDKPRRCMIRTSRRTSGTRLEQIAAADCGVAWKAACAMSESAEGTPAATGPATRAGAPRGSAPVQGTRRQRRPTGTPPPLPHPISVSTTAWVLLAVVIVAFAFVFSEITPGLRSDDQANTWVLLRLAVVVLIMVFRRWRHLAVFLGSLFFLEIVGGQLIYNGLSRPRPYDMLIIGSWGGYSAPSIPVAGVTIFLVAAVYGLVVPGRTRTYGKIAAAAVIAVFGLARLYLAVDHPDDVLLGVALGVAVPVA